MNHLPQDAVLIVIDVQRAFEHPSWGQRNNVGAEASIAALLAAWRAGARPLIHVHHRSQRRESLFHVDAPGLAVKPEAQPLPGETVIYKDVNSCFIGTDLEQRLRARGASTLVIVGLTTDHCVSTTTRMAGNLGFTTFLVADATATFERVGPDGARFTAEQMHATALASLHQEFATIVDSAAVLRAL